MKKNRQEVYKEVKELILNEANKCAFRFSYVSEERINEIFKNWSKNKIVNQLLNYKKYDLKLDDIEFIIADYYEMREEYQVDLGWRAEYDKHEYFDDLKDWFFDDVFSSTHTEHSEKYWEEVIVKILESASVIIHELRCEEKLAVLKDEVGRYTGIDVDDIDEEDLDIRTQHILKDYNYIKDNIKEYADWDCQIFCIFITHDTFIQY